MAIPNMAMIPSGYKPTKLYSVLPTPENGSELIANGDFTTGSNWILGSGWSISGGSATFVGSAYGAAITQTNITTLGKTYAFKCDLTDGSFDVRVGSNAYFLYTGQTLYVSADNSGSASVVIRPRSSTVTIDNVSIQEVITADADFTVTRASSATRVNEQGLIETPEFIIGGDVITNGDFSDGSNGWNLFNNTGTSTNITNGVLNIVSDGTVTDASQSNVMIIGKQYKVTLDVIATNGAKLSNNNNSVVYDTSTTGSKDFYIVTDSSTFTLKRFGGVTDVTIDNISVIEVERENIPRLDYTDGGCPVLLTEPQSTNLITESEDFSGSSWTKQSGITLTSNTTDVLSPSGLYNANKVVSTDATKGFFYPSLNVTSDATRAIYLKGSAGGETVLIKDSSGFGGSTAHTLTTDWARYEHKTVNDGSTYQGLFVDDISVGTIYAWGAQLEELSYATSYMPTYGAISTRASETVSNAGDANTYNSTEGVLFWEGVFSNSGYKFISLGDSTTSNRVAIYSNSATTISFNVKVGGSNSFSGNITGVISNQVNKLALLYKENNFSIWLNGVKKFESLTGSVFPIGTLNNLSFDDGNDNSEFYGKTSQVQVFNTALSDAELITLTTI